MGTLLNLMVVFSGQLQHAPVLSNNPKTIRNRIMNSPLRFAALFFVAHCFVIFPTRTRSSGPQLGHAAPTFKIIGPLYGVGMLDLSVFLLTGGRPHSD